MLFAKHSCLVYGSISVQGLELREGCCQRAQFNKFVKANTFARLFLYVNVFK